MRKTTAPTVPPRKSITITASTTGRPSSVARPLMTASGTPALASASGRRWA